jgi:hypothetical protein
MRIPRVFSSRVIAAAWLISGSVPSMSMRSKQEITPRIADA